MDATDVRIFCEMADRQGGYNILLERKPSTGAVARQLRLDEKTVRTRVRRMEKEGFIQFYQADPHLGLLGIDTVATYRFETVNLTTKRNLVAAVERSPMILEAHEFIGPYLSARIGGSDENPPVKTARDLARQFELATVPLGSVGIDAPPMTLDRLDWRLVQALRFDARRGTREVARDLGITERMAEYRLAKLMNSGALRVRAVLDSQHQQGLVFYELEVALEESHRQATLDRMRERFGPHFWSIHRPTEGVLIANLFGFTLAAPESAALDVQQYPGVHRCGVFIQKTAIESPTPGWIDARIASALEGAARPPR